MQNFTIFFRKIAIFFGIFSALALTACGGGGGGGGSSAPPAPGDEMDITCPTAATASDILTLEFAPSTPPIATVRVDSVDYPFAPEGTNVSILLSRPAAESSCLDVALTYASGGVLGSLDDNVSRGDDFTAPDNVTIAANMAQASFTIALLTDPQIDGVTSTTPPGRYEFASIEVTAVSSAQVFLGIQNVGGISFCSTATGDSVDNNNGVQSDGLLIIGCTIDAIRSIANGWMLTTSGLNSTGMLTITLPGGASHTFPTATATAAPICIDSNLEVRPVNIFPAWRWGLRNRQTSPACTASGIP